MNKSQKKKLYYTIADVFSWVLAIAAAALLIWNIVC